MLRAPSFKLRKSATAVLSDSGERLLQIAQRVVVWDVAQRRVMCQCKILQNEWHVAISPDDRTLAVKGENGELAFFDLASQTVIAKSPVTGLRDTGCKPEFSADGRYLLDGSWNGALRVWEVSTAREVARIDAPGYSINAIAVARGSDEYFIAQSRSGGNPDTRLLQVGGLDIDRARPLPSSAASLRWAPISHLAVDRAGRTLAVALAAANGNALASCDIASGTVVARDLPRRHDVRGLCVTNDGLVIASIHNAQPLEGLSFNAFREAVDKLELTHLHFLDAASMEPLAAWHWKGAWMVSAASDNEALAVGGDGESGAYLVSDAFKRGAGDRLRACERQRPVTGPE